jgi:hypothetical protein
MSIHDLIILQGVSVGSDPMTAGFLVHAVIEEAARLGKRIATGGGIISTTVALRTLSIKVRLPDSLPMVDREKDLDDLKKLFSEVARVAYAKTKG